MSLKSVLLSKPARKTCVYACFTSDMISLGIRAFEDYLSSKNLKFRRFVNPLPESAIPGVVPIYGEGKFINVFELRNEFNRIFYIFPSQLPVDPEEFTKPDFAIAFSLKDERSFEVLLRMIFARKISGGRFKHRSMMSFFLSIGVSMVLSSLFEVKSIVVQIMVTGVLAFGIFMIMDYPFSVLYFRGVSIVPLPRVTRKALIIAARRSKK